MIATVTVTDIERTFLHLSLGVTIVPFLYKIHQNKSKRLRGLGHDRIAT